ncbi:MAG: diguanylate cyclase [Eubacterium sp.]
MKAKMRKLFVGALLCFAISSVVYIFVKETEISVRLSVLAANLLFATLIIHATHQSRKVRKMLQVERDDLRMILDRIPLPLFIVDKERHLNFINTAALELFQCEEDILGKSCYCLNTCICDTLECAIDKMEKTGNRRTYYEANGRSYMVSTATLESNMSKSGKYIELIEDITEVVEAKKELEEKTIELETMSENILGGVLITTMDEGYPVIRCNAGYREMTGRSEKQTVGQRAMQWVMQEDAVRLNDEIKRQLADGNKVSVEHRLHMDSGTILWVSLQGKRTVLRGKEVGVWILTDISSAKEVELALRIDEERYRIAMQSIEDIVIDYDIKTHVMYHSSKAMEIYGVPEFVENMPQSILDNGTILEESRDVYLNLFRQLATNVKNCNCILKTRAKDGRILWNRLTFTAIFDDEGNTAHAIGILQDITREKSIELQHQRETRYLELSSKEGTFYYEADLTNKRFLMGHESIVQMYGKVPTDDFNTVIDLLLKYKIYEPDREIVRTYTKIETLTNAYNAGVLRTGMEYRRIIDGKPIWSECSMQCFIDPEDQNLHCVGCIRNINEMKIKELALQEKAERDLMTGLYNKVTTELLIKNLTDFAEKDEVSGAFMLIDLDNFKNVNDTLGHISGDEVISKASKGLLPLFRQGDIVGRIGGDEFVVYMNRIESEEIVVKKAHQICDMLHAIEITNDHAYKISGTIGIAMFPTHGKNFEELYKKADRALYYAKEQGKDKFIIF